MAPRRYVRLHEQVKVPVFKNVVFALKLVWQADKRLFLGYIIGYTADKVFSLFVQNILFLKILLSIIDGERDFEVYVKYLVSFLIISVY